MDNLPLSLAKSLQLQCSEFQNTEFTKFIPAKIFRESLWDALDLNHITHHGNKFANRSKEQSTADAQAEDSLERYRAIFDAAKSFDFDGEVVFGKQKPRRARVHAA